ncbi:hypothetical protein [Methylocapsa sp. S129]|uniref:hypothetical protein n=1 Tax=Methylocapsa sp. S129 TaxID=1641869 RepID=UPI00131DF977|nr:hypothetical protein [Methylocapsa sp. S129]
MVAFLTLLAAALLRSLIAKGAGLELEAWLEARFPALPHLACAAAGVLIAVLVIEIAALGVEALFGRGGGE